jgi:hypothetical protein
MANTSLLAHELFCLHLKSFYGEQPCSPSTEAPAGRASKKKGGKRFPSASSLRLRKWRS